MSNSRYFCLPVYTVVSITYCVLVFLAWCTLCCQFLCIFVIAPSVFFNVIYGVDNSEYLPPMSVIMRGILLFSVF